MLAFVISLDDVIITKFVKTAGQDTLPTNLLGQLCRVITPEINGISIVLLAVSLMVVTVFFLFTRKCNLRGKIGRLARLRCSKFVDLLK